MTIFVVLLIDKIFFLLSIVVDYVIHIVSVEYQLKVIDTFTTL